ncbi:hypothetical protein HJC23_009039 [Cyclotella cryptica]|uniref:Hsp70-Hsp90 organising protein n=1 Tax=Cyclotella cryptica TaxID=29204 RepID=A0ABD3QYD4_9STRA
MSNPDAEAKKELGNKAFAANDYDEAIKHYTAAIAIDSKNCVYYSNRSACYGGKKDWASAAADAKECIKVNPTFIKGYYRLASAQSELQEFDAALATIKQGLAIEPDNTQLQKQLRLIKAKRSTAKRSETQPERTAASSATPAASYHNLNPAIQKEVIDLQQQLISTTKEYRTVKANILRAQKEKRSNELTKSELDKLPPSETEVKMYRSIGKMFMLTPRSEVMTHLDESIERESKVESDLEGKLDYLERRMKSQQANIAELTKSAANIVHYPKARRCNMAVVTTNIIALKEEAKVEVV